MNPLYLDASGTGPAALFVHGFPLNHTMWKAQTEHLSDVRTCLAPDLAGFGASSNDGGAALTMERHADDLVRILDAYEVERADVIGLSMGGYVALAMRERHASRFRSLTLVDTKAEADDAAGKAKRDAGILSLRTNGRSALAQGMLPKLVAEGAADKLRHQLTAIIEGTDEDSIALALEGMRDRPDRTALLRGVDVPSLVICGEHDALTPPSVAREMARALPQSELVIVEGAGHMAPMENPGAVNAALRKFLSAL